MLLDPPYNRACLYAMSIFVSAIHGMAAETSPPNPVKDTITYKRADDLEIKADVFHFPSEKIRPAVVWIHGGALIMGSREGRFPWRDMILANGFVLVSLDYRLAPQAKLPEIISDIEDAFLWLRKEGPARFHIHPERIAVVGGSAGGYLTLVTGHRVKPRPRALISLFGYGGVISDWYTSPSQHPRHNTLKITEAEAWKSVEGPVVANDRQQRSRGAFYNFCRQRGLWPKMVSGWDPRAEAEKFYPYMPVKNVTADYPPTVLIHGTADTDVPYEESVLMAAEFQKYNVPFEFYTIANGEHGLDGGDPAEIANAYAKAFEFLKKRLDSQ